MYFEMLPNNFKGTVSTKKERESYFIQAALFHIMKGKMVTKTALVEKKCT